jgi:hypothetical protein
METNKSGVATESIKIKVEKAAEPNINRESEKVDIHSKKLTVKIFSKFSRT